MSHLYDFLAGRALFAIEQKVEEIYLDPAVDVL